MQRATNRIRNFNPTLLGCAAVALAVAGVTPNALAVDVLRTATAGSLNALTSWGDGVTGPVPGATDVAVWDTGSATAGSLGADLSFGGVRVGTIAGTLSISGANILTIGADGIDMSAATQNLNLQPGATTTPASGIVLGAAQTWNIGAGRLVQQGSSASGMQGAIGASLTKTGLGTIYFNNGGNTFAGGVVLNAGAITFNTNSTVAASAVSAGPLGTGTLTINGGTLSVNTTSGRDIANNVVVNGDFTIGLAGTSRVRSAGTWDLGGATRNITLTKAGVGINDSSEQFGFIAQGPTGANKVFTLSNGTMRFVAGAAATAANPSTVNFAQGSGGVFFANNSGLTIGNNVLALEGSSQTQGGTNSPKLTIEAGGTLYMGSNSAPKSFTAHSLAGAGMVTTGTADLVNNATVGTLTIDGTAGSTTFSGTINDNITILGIAASGSKTAVSKTGGSTQTFSGTNTYTGNTGVTGGTLVVGAAQAIPQASPTTVSNATIKLGTTALTTLDSLTIGTNGKFDLGTGQLLLNNGGGATALANFVALLTTGRAGGAGFFTSSATGNADVGFKDTGTGIYARYTLLGDADLNGTVDFNDFLALQTGFGQAGSFVNGDANYDGMIDFNDFLALQTNFGQSVGGGAVAFSAEQVAAVTAFGLTNAVPEPASLALVGLGAAAMLRRRRA